MSETEFLYSKILRFVEDITPIFHTTAERDRWRNRVADAAVTFVIGLQGAPPAHDDEFTQGEEFLLAEIKRLRLELENIATADPTTWHPETRDQFREWAQNRARHAILHGRSQWDADMREWERTARAAGYAPGDSL